MNFVVAVMAATTAVKGGVKLHTSIIRIGSQWIAACSVLLEFNLDQLKSFAWSEEEEEMKQLQECADANATACNTDSEGLKMPWPPEATQAMQSLFSVLNVVPRIATVEFATSCFAQTIVQNEEMKGLKLMGPAVYYLTNPIFAMVAVYLVCASVVHGLVPLANRFGVHFNPKANRLKATAKAIEKLSMCLEPLLPGLGLNWEDVKESGVLESATLESIEDGIEAPHEFIDGELAFSKPLAIKMCLQRARQESYLANLSRRIRLNWDAFTANPELLVWGMTAESLQETATEQLSPSQLETFAKRALVWKHRAIIQEEAELADVDPVEVAAKVADSYDSATDVYERVFAGEQMEAFKAFCSATCDALRRPIQKESHSRRTLGQLMGSSSATVDIEALDFGLFSYRPWPRRLFIECIPVFWVMLLAMWPTLLSNFLKLLWCVPILEDNDAGITITKQRLKPDPELVCWSRDHILVAMICFIGLSVWCLGVPILLYLNMWILKDRQSPDNNRKYGFFIQGYEPQFWWWDIIVKRLDVGTMNLVTYTSLAADEKAKLLLFPILSGCQLGIFSWYKPFTEAQGRILDVLEMTLLITRFSLFSVVSIILIFNPSTTVTMVLAGSLVSLMAFTCAFFGLHIVAQFLRGAAEDMASEEKEKSPKKNKKEEKSKKSMANLAVSIKTFAIQTALPLFLPSDDEKFLLQWSPQMTEVEVVSAAQLKTEATTRRRCNRLVSACKRVRALVLRLGPSVERQNFAKAISEFSALWLDSFDQLTLPIDTVYVLLILAETSGYIPTQTPLAETAAQWHHHARGFIHGEHHGKLLSSDNLVETRVRLLKLGTEDAVNLVTKVQHDLMAHRKRISQAILDKGPAKESQSSKALSSVSFALPGWDASPLSLDKVKDRALPEKPMMEEMAIQTIQSSFVKKTAAPLGDLPREGPASQLQVEIHEAPKALPEPPPPKPKALAPKPPAVDVPDVSADVPVEPRSTPLAKQAAPKAPVAAPAPAVRAVAKASRPPPPERAPTSPLAASGASLASPIPPDRPEQAEQREQRPNTTPLPPPVKGRSVKAAPRPPPEAHHSPAEAKPAAETQPLPVHGAVVLERQMTSETEETAESQDEEE